MYSGVGGLGYPNSINVRSIILPTLSVLDPPPNSAYAADTATRFSMPQTVCIVSLIFIGYVLIDITPKKYWLPILDRPFSLVKNN